MAAAEVGASVIMIETMDVLGGNWIYGDFDLVKTFCEQSFPTLNWIQQNWKMPFQDNVTTVYGGLWQRGHSPENEFEKGAGYFRHGKQYAEELGVEIIEDNCYAKSLQNKSVHRVRI